VVGVSQPSDAGEGFVEAGGPANFVRTERGGVSEAAS